MMNQPVAATVLFDVQKQFSSIGYRKLYLFDSNYNTKLNFKIYHLTGLQFMLLNFTAKANENSMQHAHFGRFNS